MTISNNYVPVKQIGNGATVTFSANWNVIAAEYLRVYLEDVDTGVQTLQVLDTDYELTFDETGLTVDFTISAAPTSDNYVVIARSVTIDQDDQIKVSKGFQGAVIEAAYDKLTAIAQDTNDSLSRTPKFRIGSDFTDVIIADLVDQTTLLYDLATNTLLPGATADEIANAQAYAEAASTYATNAGNSAAAALASQIAAALSVAAANLPSSLVGAALKMLRVNAGETGYEFRTAAQVRSDINAQVAGSYATSGANSDITSMTALTSINGGQIGGRRNKIINGCGKVAQRAIGTTDNSYTLDRWRVLMEAANACTVSQVASGSPTAAGSMIRLTVGSGNNNKFGIFQVLENTDAFDLRNIVSTLSAAIKATAGISNVKMALLSWAGSVDGVSGDPISSWGADGVNPTLAANWSYINTPVNLNVATSFSALPYSVNGTYSGNNIAVFIWCDDKTTTQTTDMLDISLVQLEAGSVATTYENRSFQDELRDCQRYFRKSFPYATAPAQNTGSLLGAPTGTGQVNNQRFGSYVPFAPVMRSAPTVTTYSPNAASANWQTNGTTPTVAVATIGDAGMYLAGTTSVSAANDYAIHYQADAEL